MKTVVIVALAVVATKFQLRAQSDAFRVPQGVVIEVVTFTMDKKAGGRVAGTEEIVAVREDGAKAEWIKYAKTAQLGFSHRLLDFPATAERVVIDRVSGTKSTTRGVPAQISSRAAYVAKGKHGSCMGELAPQLKSVLTRTLEDVVDIDGLRTVRIKTVVNASGKTELSWLAPEYNCLLVQQLVTEGDSESRRQVKSLKFGTPDPSLFEIPSDLQADTP